MDAIDGRDRYFFFSDRECQTFGRVELHLVGLLPLLEEVEVLLQLDRVIWRVYGSVEKTIICKKSDFRLERQV